MGSPSGPRISYWGSISVYGVPSAYSPVCSTGVMTMVPSTGTSRMARSCSWLPSVRCGCGRPSSPITLMRISRPRSGSSGVAGGWARPSRKWHDEQDWALKSGPSPSRPSVDAGAVTQLSLKKLLPTANVRRCSPSRPGTGWAKAPVPNTSTVASPPWSASSCAVGGRAEVGSSSEQARRATAAAAMIASDDRRTAG